MCGLAISVPQVACRAGFISMPRDSRRHSVTELQSFSRRMKLWFRFLLLLFIPVAVLAQTARLQCTTDSKEGTAKFRAGVKPRLLEDAPLKAKFGNHFVCWTFEKLLEDRGKQTIFGPCNITSKGVDALFAFFGKEMRSPRVSVVLQEKLFWGKFSNTTADPVCDPPHELGERGEAYTIEGRGAITIRRDEYSACKGWYAGKWIPSSMRAYFGCDGKEVTLRIEDIKTEDVFVLCSVVVSGFNPRTCTAS